jgi:histidinol-phosphate phosphatase family protein
MTKAITIAYGDGIGPEIMESTIEILKEAKADLSFNVIEVGKKIYEKGFNSGLMPSAWESLNEIHAYLISQCHIDMVKVCIHTSEDRCNCRKPNPGMLIEASEELGIDLSESYMIGDRWGDIEAGQKSGCKNSFFIDYGYTEKQPTGDFILVKSLSECTDIILKIQTNNN